MKVKNKSVAAYTPPACPPPATTLHTTHFFTSPSEPHFFQGDVILEFAGTARREWERVGVGGRPLHTLFSSSSPHAQTEAKLALNSSLGGHLPLDLNYPKNLEGKYKLFWALMCEFSSGH